MPRNRRPFLALAALAALAAGCGDGPELAEVGGVVTLDGRPLPGAAVMFVPDLPDGSPSYGTTDDQGRYRLAFTRDKTGAMPGRHRVEISVEPPSADEIAEARAKKVPVDRPGAALPRAAREGSLPAEVASDENEIDFHLKSEPKVASARKARRR